MKCLIIFLALLICSLGSPINQLDSDVLNGTYLDSLSNEEYSAIIPNTDENPQLDGDGRIIGGVNANIQMYPWQLSLRVENRHICGASILSRTRGLTAAHCWSNRVPLGSYSIQAGSTTRNGDIGAVRMGILRFIPHPQFNSINFNNDIAVLWFANVLPLNPRIRPIRLAPHGTQVPYGAIATITGWGLTRENDESSAPNILQVTSVSILTNRRCNQVYRGRVLNTMFCAGVPQGGRDACQGDLGGPLIANGVQFGIISWGIGCGRPNNPGVYTRIPVYTNWVRSVS